MKAEPRRNGRRRQAPASRRSSPAEQSPRETEFPVLMQGDRATYVLLPIEEYERLMHERDVDRLLARVEDPNVKWVDADDLAIELAAESVVKARKAAGLTQTQLAKKLGVPQSQISRIERNPDRTTVRTLKRIAKALRVDVSALI
jgi:DNA-binding XRE family transcriptional regulator